MRTYSHAALTWAAARLAAPSEAGAASWGALGATLPDLPVILGAAWLGAQRRRLGRTVLREEVCAKRSFAGPDAALHSALPVGVLFLISWAFGPRGRGKPPAAFLAGWAGHVLADALTHAEDARPVLWPASGRRFRAPISYWDRSHHARAFTVAEHGASLLLVAWAVARRLRHPAPPGG